MTPSENTTPQIQFIVVGWHYSYQDLIDGLIELEKNNEYINVFWSCHKEPTDYVKENFNYKVFPNLGLEDGAYQQALDYLNLPDNTILFLIHDDLVIKDWNFMNICLNSIGKYKIIGNCLNYPCVFDPQEVFDGNKAIDYVKDECKHLFDSKIFIKTIRASFICIQHKDLKEVGYFEVMWEPPDYDREEGLVWGNLPQSLFGYKATKVFTLEKIAYLSDRYLDSDFIYECARGKVTDQHPITNYKT